MDVRRGGGEFGQMRTSADRVREDKGPCGRPQAGTFLLFQHAKGPSIYDIHTEEGQVQVDACGPGEGSAPCGRPDRKLKLEPIDVILLSSHAKKLASFFIGISSLDGMKSGNFRRYKSIIYFFRLIPQVAENGAAREPCQRRRPTPKACKRAKPPGREGGRG